jgi:hypothetical protein
MEIHQKKKKKRTNGFCLRIGKAPMVYSRFYDQLFDLKKLLVTSSFIEKEIITLNWSKIQTNVG